MALQIQSEVKHIVRIYCSEPIKQGNPKPGETNRKPILSFTRPENIRLS